MPLGGLLPYNEEGPEQAAYQRALGLAAGGLGTIQGKGAAAVPQPPPLQQVTRVIGKDGQGTVTVKLSDQAAEHMNRLMLLGQQAQDLWSQGIAQALAKKEVLEQNPLLAQIGRLTSAISANYIAPGSRGQGILNAVGATGLDYFQDTPESLATRAAQMGAQKFGLQGSIVNQLEDQRRFELQEKRIDAITGKTEAEAEVRSAREERILKDSWAGGFYTNAAQGEDASAAFAEGAKLRGFSDAEIRAGVSRIRTSASAANKRFSLEAQQRSDLRQQDMAFQASLARESRASSKEEAEAARRLAAVSRLDTEITNLEAGAVAAEGTLAAYAAAAGLPEGATPDQIISKAEVIDPVNKDKVRKDIIAAKAALFKAKSGVPKFKLQKAAAMSRMREEEKVWYSADALDLAFYLETGHLPGQDEKKKLKAAQAELEKSLVGQSVVSGGQSSTISPITSVLKKGANLVSGGLLNKAIASSRKK